MAAGHFCSDGDLEDCCLSWEGKAGVCWLALCLGVLCPPPLILQAKVGDGGRLASAIDLSPGLGSHFGFLSSTSFLEISGIRFLCYVEVGEGQRSSIFLSWLSLADIFSEGGSNSGSRGLEELSHKRSQRLS